MDFWLLLLLVLLLLSRNSNFGLDLELVDLLGEEDEATFASDAEAEAEDEADELLRVPGALVVFEAVLARGACVEDELVVDLLADLCCRLLCCCCCCGCLRAALLGDALSPSLPVSWPILLRRGRSQSTENSIQRYRQTDKRIDIERSV